MKITPLEIRQKTFEKKLRGYDKDEVDAFLTSLSQEWERLNTENKELKIRIESLSQDVQKLREVESSLFKTLKTAEDTSTGMVDQARKDAELHLREAHLNAEALMTDARQQAKNMIDDAEEIVKESLESVKQQAKEVEQECREVERIKENYIHELKSLAQDTLSRAERMEAKKNAFEEIKVPDAETVVGNYEIDIEEPTAEDVIETPVDTIEEREISFEVSNQTEEVEEEISVTEEKSSEDEKKSEGSSFFDSI